MIALLDEEDVEAKVEEDDGLCDECEGEEEKFRAVLGLRPTKVVVCVVLGYNAGEEDGDDADTNYFEIS